MKKVAKRRRKREERLNPEWASRVNSLLKKLGLTQSQLLRKLDYTVTKGSVSMWARGRVPSRDAYMALARIAPYPDNLWFYSRVGLSRTALQQIGRQLLRDEAAQLFSDPGELISVRAIRKTDGGEQEEEFRIPVPKHLALDPLTTECYVVAESSASADLAAGDLVVVDTRSRESQDLTPLWDQVVLVEFFKPEPNVIGKSYSTGIPEHGLYIGRLRYKRIIRELGRPAKVYPAWTVTLGPCNDQQTLVIERMKEVPPYTVAGFSKEHTVTLAVESDLVGLAIGAWLSHSQRDLDFGDTDADWARAEEQAEKRVATEAELFAGVRILGRVLGRYWKSTQVRTEERER